MLRIHVCASGLSQIRSRAKATLHVSCSISGCSDQLPQIKPCKICMNMWKPPEVHAENVCSYKERIEHNCSFMEKKHWKALSSFDIGKSNLSNESTPACLYISEVLRYVLHA